MSRPYPPYQDNPRADPFADGSTGSRGTSYDQGYSDRNDYDPYDSNTGNGATRYPENSDNIPLQASLAGDTTSRGYTGLPHNESQADLSLANPAPYAAGATAAGRHSVYNNGFVMERGYSNNALGQGGGYVSGRSSSSALDSGPSPWLQHQQKGQQRSKFLIWGGVLVVVGLIIIGVVVGVVVSNNRKKNEDTKSSTSDAVNQTDPNDPSTFIKDPNLHQAFYGMAYTPENSQLPGCGNKLSEVIQDIQLISQLTKRIRLYGSDCNQTALVLEAIKRTKVDMEVFIGNYPIPTDGGAAYRRQRDIMKQAIETYGTDHIAGVTVGNEFMLNYLGANGASDPNSAVGDTGAALLISDIQDTRDMLASLNLQTTPPVGTSDAGSYFNTKVLEAVDYGLANVHPWFANVTAETAASWTTNFFQEQNVDVAAKLSNTPKMYIAETGWPTKSSDAGNANNGASDASISNLQTFIDTFVCQANSAGVPYFFFEFSDEPWKDAQFGGVEGWWGLFSSSRKLKDGITIPTCTAP
ncbi:hypothetical protein H1R20_g14549, partial [Candolleomyces eurysporus]